MDPPTLPHPLPLCWASWSLCVCMFVGVCMCKCYVCYCSTSVDEVCPLSTFAPPLKPYPATSLKDRQAIFLCFGLVKNLPKTSLSHKKYIYCLPSSGITEFNFSCLACLTLFGHCVFIDLLSCWDVALRPANGLLNADDSNYGSHSSIVWSRAHNSTVIYI